jgi:DNA-binding transcriptional LysR family regulator
MSLESVDWALWRSFLAILRESSLSGAARAMGTAHPTVRRHLDELEAKLGGPLFIRSPSGLVATERALSLRDAAQAMESAASLLIRTASADAGAATGTVRIAASEVVGVEVLPPILFALKAEHPQLSFELTLSNKFEDVLRHDADIAVRMTRPSQGGLLARKIGSVQLGLYAHETWIARQGEPVSLAGLIVAGSLIGYDRDPSIIRALAARDVQATSAAFGFRSDNDLAQLAALRAGLGVGFCQQPIAARDLRLRHVLPEIEHALEIWLVTHPNLRNVRRVRATFDGLARGLAGHVDERPQTS